MCKMAHLGNCDPETADQEYCIFHKPNKSEEEAVEFYRKFLQRFKPRVEEIEVEGNTIKRLVFEEPVDARGFVFPNTSLLFRYSKFKKSVDFYKVSFNEFDFENSTFEDILVLSGSHGEYLTFRNATIRRLSFSEASVGIVIFNGATIKSAHFNNSVFGKLEFSNVNVQDVLEFHRVKVKERSLFSYSKLDGTTLFYAVSFGKDATFTKAKFDKPVEFKDCIFENSEFGDAYFASKVSFSGSIFMDNVSFKHSKFDHHILFNGKLRTYKYKFYNKLDFSHADIRKGIDIDIPSEWFRLPEAEIEARRVQRLSYEKEGKRDEADRMFVLEMRAKRRARLQNARNKFERIKARAHNFVEWLLADLPSEYGTNWIRLFLMSLLVIIGNAVPYAVWSNFIDGFPETSNIVVRFANALYYSLVTFTTLGYGDMHPTGWLKALSAIEALTGAVFMALIVAVIARKWMR